jgi:hypothetical protein
MFFLFSFSAVFSQGYYYRRDKFVKATSITAGAAFNQEYNALKFDLIAHNVVFKVVGFYTSFEIGMNSNYFSNIIGLNVSFAHIGYLFAGMDLFSQYGMINYYSNDGPGVRKELGVGFTPYKDLVIQAGFSLNVSLTLTVGYRIPFSKMKSKKRKYKRALN